jgi:arylsulfatase A-like enzyme
MTGTGITKRTFLKAAAAGLFASAAGAQEKPPNIVLIVADDLGYGDVGCYGSRIQTPNLDAMARDGARFSQFYAGSPVCSPSRAALLTGRYPTRTGVIGVLFPNDRTGLAESEITMAQMLKDQGYRTMCAGKWHLGAQPPYAPTSRGFDEYFGVLHGHNAWPLQLTHNTEVIEEPANLAMLTQRTTEQAASFIARSKESPFFLYYAHTSPHIPLVASRRFQNHSTLGSYGDLVAELDWTVGQILAALQENGLDERTLVLFTSDNGPWFQGSPGMLRGRKGETLEGGVRVPFIARYPRHIPRERTCSGVASAMDLFPTVARLAGAWPAQALDGLDIWPLLSGECEEMERDLLLYFDAWHLQCARSGRWKLHLSRYNSVAWTPIPQGGRLNLPLPRPELYDLADDPTESYDAAARYPDVVAQIRERIDALLPALPHDVGANWAETMRTAVEDTPSGALPIRRA